MKINLALRKYCTWCKEPINRSATVCKVCGRHQGWIGWVSSASIVIGVVVALLGAVASGISATTTVVERVEISKIRDEIIETRENMAATFLASAGGRLSFALQRYYRCSDCEYDRRTVSSEIRYFHSVVNRMSKVAPDTALKVCKRTLRAVSRVQNQDIQEEVSRQIKMGFCGQISLTNQASGT